MARIEANDFEDYDFKESKPEKKKKVKSKPVSDSDIEIAVTTEKKNRKFLIAVIFVLAAVLLAAAIFLLIRSLSSDVVDTDKIYAGVTVNGYSLEDMTQQEAEDYIKRTYIDPIETENVVIIIGDDELTYPLSQFVTCPDAAKTAEEAYKVARTGSKKSRVKQIAALKTSPVNFDIEYVLHNDTFEEIVKKAYDSLFVTVVNPTYEIRGDIINFTPGKPGCDVNTAKLSDDLENMLTTLKNNLADSDSHFAPDPITVETSVVPFSEIDYREIYDSVQKEAVNASFYRISLTEVGILDDEPGVTVDLDLLIEAVDSVNRGDDFLYKEVKLSETQAELTTEKLSEMLFRDILGSELSSNRPEEGEDGILCNERGENIALAVEKINGYVMMPGDSFNFFTVLGNVNKTEGFVEAIENYRGADSKIIGGGISQVASAIYVSVIYSELSVQMRSTGQYIPNFGLPGFDAYVENGKSYFAFENNSAYPVKLSLSYEDGLLSVKIYGTDSRTAKFTLSSEIKKVIHYDTVRTDTDTLPKGVQVVTEGITGYEYAIYKNYDNLKTPISYVTYSKRDRTILIGTGEAEPENPENPDEPENPETPEEPDIPDVPTVS